MHTVWLTLCSLLIAILLGVCHADPIAKGGKGGGHNSGGKSKDGHKSGGKSKGGHLGGKEIHLHFGGGGGDNNDDDY